MKTLKATKDITVIEHGTGKELGSAREDEVLKVLHEGIFFDLLENENGSRWEVPKSRLEFYGLVDNA